MARRPRAPQSVFNLYKEDMLKLLQGDYENKTTLYSHQVTAALKVNDYFDLQQNPTNRNGIAIVVLPTGCGKTGVAILASYVLGASRVLVITPSRDISRQIDEEYSYFLINARVMDAIFGENYDVSLGITDDQRRDKYDNYMDALPSVSFIKEAAEIRARLRSSVMVVNAHKIGGQSRVRIGDIPHGCYDLVIVDEAHHYPAPTWQLLVDHFSDSRRLFLTATPEHRGGRILPDVEICYELKRNEAIDRGIIRNVEFDDDAEGNSDEPEEIYLSIARLMEKYLEEHDRLRADHSVKHQGMVITLTRDQARKFRDVYNETFQGDQCKVYDGEAREGTLKAFKRGNIRILVIIGRLLEGFDHKPVSVLGIVRNIAPTSRVLFAQFVGRAVRKAGADDPVSAQIVTHKCFKQRKNFETFEEIAEEDPVEEDDDS